MGEASLCEKQGQGGQWRQLSLIWNMLKKWVEKIVKSKRNWESLKKEWATLSAFLDSKKFVPVGCCKKWLMRCELKESLFQGYFWAILKRKVRNFCGG